MILSHFISALLKRGLFLHTKKFYQNFKSNTFDNEFDALRQGVTQSIRIPFPSVLIPADRFKTNADLNGLQVFGYDIREGFSSLVNEVVQLVNSKSINSMVYIGNVGSGKSHNLAALVFYLRECKKRNETSFAQDVVYISNCNRFFHKTNHANSLRTVLIDKKEEFNSIYY
jgi:hypothetical protein